MGKENSHCSPSTLGRPANHRIPNPDPNAGVEAPRTYRIVFFKKKNHTHTLSLFLLKEGKKVREIDGNLRLFGIGGHGGKRWRCHRRAEECECGCNGSKLKWGFLYFSCVGLEKQQGIRFTFDYCHSIFVCALQSVYSVTWLGNITEKKNN